MNRAKERERGRKTQAKFGERYSETEMMRNSSMLQLFFQGDYVYNFSLRERKTLKRSLDDGKKKGRRKRKEAL